ncbi:ABC-type transporter Mla MlaB component [Tamilnaduibacter salinus]|uniref:ABC-type transporter Mla MlaB component n=1 Tax=Tamilnaduibacter salinus TaxID=1484056 RepID=A0A2A2I2L7_9GAMM|nr:STAS domain-containing protein [Tamilnaduibacter salinus]PAV25330.1 NTP-binding protein [Tamilnaduibacter salinus]PVY70770.1 ABC-type transporter Mla MlaB component [Tamilnaduibacter salinus]
MTGHAPSLTVDRDGRFLLAGRVGASDVVRLREEGERAIAGVTGDDCRLDLSGLDNASSIIVSLLLRWQQSAARQGVSLRCLGASDDLCAMARMGGVAHTIPGLVEGRGL